MFILSNIEYSISQCGIFEKWYKSYSCNNNIFLIYLKTIFCNYLIHSSFKYTINYIYIYLYIVTYKLE
ncbi:hypothetical protein PFMALIP_02299 [Plasmodium falciparum MaliPS096_E11]|uniref:Uncharacterized protein n=2 Tax=Plasmodium falciparum TaxID=5833 RepID=A0A024WSV6_PLAFA|nr:hypothetical protein PFFVO_02294 [Plasmodium falciparum Vietnam Oak-Knoll (FVO)]ETW49591.1 hypothetical protein PFMALIP_02299 [Plasmodium falciparum MaliPS096_E11]